MATYRKTPAGSFQAIVRVHGFKDQTKTFKLKKDARTWATRVEGDHDLLRSLGSVGATMTFSVLADEFEKQWSKKDNITGKVKFWTDRVGDLPLLSITSTHIREILDEHAAGAAKCGKGRHDTGRKRAPATVNRKRAMLSAIFTYAIEKEYVDVNPVTRVPTLTENNKRKRYLSEGERVTLLATCKASSWNKLYLLVLMAITTGARQGELLKLRWCDIDHEKRTANLIDTKNSDDRTVTIPPETMRVLLEFPGIGPTLIFPSPTKFRKPFEFRKHWDKALHDAGIEHFHFHDLRHSCASMMIDRDASLAQIGEVLGHRSTQTTARYAHLSDARKQSLMDDLMAGIS